jgi:hypothetical protein
MEYGTQEIRNCEGRIQKTPLNMMLLRGFDFLNSSRLKENSHLESRLQKHSSINFHRSSNAYGYLESTLLG